MIAKAKAAVPRARFIVGDAGRWQPNPEADLVFSNAAFQWVPEHARHLARILEALKPGAMLAVQMPDTLNEPSHVHMAKTASRLAYAAKLAGAVKARSPLLSAQGYHQILRPLCSGLEIWRTAYHHQLSGHQGIMDILSFHQYQAIPRPAGVGRTGGLPRGLPQGHCPALSPDG